MRASESGPVDNGSASINGHTDFPSAQHSPSWRQLHRTTDDTRPVIWTSRAPRANPGTGLGDETHGQGVTQEGSQAGVSRDRTGCRGASPVIASILTS